MSHPLLTVEQVSEELGLHPKTVLRHIREGRLGAARVGKAYRIRRTDLNAFLRLSSRGIEPRLIARTTSITDISGVALDTAQGIATFLQSAALTGDACTPSLQVQTVYDPQGTTLKIVLIGLLQDVCTLLELLRLHLEAHS